MVRKSKSPSRPKRRPSEAPPLSPDGKTPAERLAALLQSDGKTPAERLGALLQEAAARGVRPLDEAALEAMGGGWPEDENIDEFLAWLYKSRRTGHYD
jgi:hypothetical protein